METHEWRIDKSKITDYLLNENHPEGKSKAFWFQSHGFSREKWELYSDSIRILLEEREGEVIVKSNFGRRMVIRGMILTPRGQRARIITVWQLDRGLLRHVSLRPTVHLNESFYGT